MYNVCTINEFKITYAPNVNINHLVGDHVTACAKGCVCVFGKNGIENGKRFSVPTTYKKAPTAGHDLMRCNFPSCYRLSVHFVICFICITIERNNLLHLIIESLSKCSRKPAIKKGDEHVLSGSRLAFNFTNSNSEFRVFDWCLGVTNGDIVVVFHICIVYSIECICIFLSKILNLFLFFE